MRFRLIYGAAALAILAGCGGGGSVGQGDVSGVVFDQDGFVVRDARVYVGSKQVQSTTSGTYVLSGVPAEDIVVRAEITKNGTRYIGQNVASVNQGERTKNVNIAVFPENQTAALEGTVRDRSDRLVVGARVFLRPSANDTIPTSAVAVTDGEGHFRVGGLLAGLSYRVQVNALGYNSDVDTVALNPGEDRFVSFVMPEGTVKNVPAPQNLQAYSYTSPRTTRGNAQLSGAMEMMKRRLNPKRSSVAKLTRDTSGGNPIEIDLLWDRYTDAANATALLGFGIYRGVNGSQQQNVDFLRDPQASLFADLDPNLFEGTRYDYSITSVDTLYDGSQGENGPSNTASVTPVGDLNLGNVSAGTAPTFSWLPATGATGYFVYVFDQYPSIGVTERYVNPNPVNGTQYTYGGSSLTTGQTYYYIIVGQNAGGNGYTISPVGQFTVH